MKHTRIPRKHLRPRDIRRPDGKVVDIEMLALSYIHGAIPRRLHMRTVSIFKNNNNQAIRIPRDMEFTGVEELEIMRDGDTLILRPVRPSWSSLQEVPPVDADFLTERNDIIDDQRFMDDFE